VFTDSFYRDYDEQTRAFSQRFKKIHGKPPTGMQASAYGAVMHHLKAIKEAGTDAAEPVMAKMRATPINDFMMRNGTLRVDGRVIRDLHLLKAKVPDASKHEWDLLQVVDTIKSEDAFRP